MWLTFNGRQSSKSNGYCTMKILSHRIHYCKAIMQIARFYNQMNLCNIWCLSRYMFQLSGLLKMVNYSNKRLYFVNPLYFHKQYTFYFALDKKDLVRKDTCRVKMNSEVGKIETKKIGFCMHRNLFFNCPSLLLYFTFFVRRRTPS